MDNELWIQNQNVESNELNKTILNKTGMNQDEQFPTI